jgi:formylglycine-generating enzyme
VAEDKTPGCCVPGRSSQTPAPARPVTPTGPARGVPELVALPGGTFAMGTDDGDGFPDDGESPVREVTVGAFRISATAVSNEEFRDFVAETGHVTDAERFGWSFVFAGFLAPGQVEAAPSVAGAPWWRGVAGATWMHPEGPGSSLATRRRHPVVHVSWLDATAYCRWRGVRLPTEAEWEYAARGGLDQARFAWGDELLPAGEHRCNIWQGTFPTHNTAADGYVGTCPVDAYPPNAFGLCNVAGNVWEWCADWWGVEHSPEPVTDPAGPAAGQAKVIRGGSYLCHDSYCNRYRVAARTSNTPDSSTGNMGFRCAADVG